MQKSSFFKTIGILLFLGILALSYTFFLNQNGKNLTEIKSNLTYKKFYKDSIKTWATLKNEFREHYVIKHQNKTNEIDRFLNKQTSVNVPYWGYDQKTHQGQIICNQSVAEDIKAIFEELYQIKFPIYSIKPISEFQFEDALSMQANNTTCFDYRLKVLGSGMSKHATGMAIDINPMQNPYIHKTRIEPQNHQSDLHVGRIRTHEEMGKKVIIIFKKYGWKWGGNWKSAKDYMHFEK